MEPNFKARTTDCCWRSVKTTRTNTATDATSASGSGQSNNVVRSSLPFSDAAHADDDDVDGDFQRTCSSSDDDS